MARRHTVSNSRKPHRIDPLRTVGSGGDRRLYSTDLPPHLNALGRREASDRTGASSRPAPEGDAQLFEHSLTRGGTTMNTGTRTAEPSQLTAPNLTVEAANGVRFAYRRFARGD